MTGQPGSVDGFRSRPLSTVAALLVAVTMGQCKLLDAGDGVFFVDGVPRGPGADRTFQGSCTTAPDCVTRHGAAQPGCSWECQQSQCALTGACAPPGCVSDTIGIVDEGLCECECKDCNCVEIDCNCDLQCYLQPPPQECIELSQTGGIVLGGVEFENCIINCQDESDLSVDMPCTITDCVLPAVVIDIDINPQTQETVGTTQLPLEREVRGVDVLFVVDNSLSMEDDQMASYCAMDKFLHAASANGAQFDTGVINTNLAERTNGLLEISNPYSCRLPLSDCECGADGQLPFMPWGSEACEFHQGGDWIDTSDPSNWDLLKKTIVQGEDPYAGWEGGLQQAFRLFAQLEIDGKFQGPYETVVISDEDADGDAGDSVALCPFSEFTDRYIRQALKSTPLGFNPPTPTGTFASCKDDLAAFYNYYFTSRNIMVHGLIYDESCRSPITETEKVGEIYERVIEATNGHQAPICDCNAFELFMDSVGNTTSDMSTQLCVEELAEAEQIEGSLSAMTLFYTENGADQIVPLSASDGWLFDTSTDCFILTGNWQRMMGSFRVEFAGGPTQVLFEDVEICIDDFDPVVSSIVVTCDVNGGQTQAPWSDTDGWSLSVQGDKRCLVFTGSWRERQLSCTLEYRNQP